MTINLGNNYPNLMVQPFMPQMYMPGILPSGNVPQYYTNKYGCEDCFKTDKYCRNNNIPSIANAKIQSSPTKQFFKKLLGIST